MNMKDDNYELTEISMNMNNYKRELIKINPQLSAKVSAILYYCRNDDRIKRLISAICDHPQEITVIINKRPVDRDAYPDLFCALGQCEKITKLVIEPGIEIGDDEGYWIGEGIKSNTTIRALFLRDTDFKSTAAQSLARALHTNTTLLELNLAHNRIENSGAQAFAEALRVNSTLQRLNLSSNNIDTLGAEAIALALSVNSTLGVLNLKSNSIKTSGAVALAKILCSSPPLKNLNLAHNNIDTHGGQEIAQALLVNTILRNLNLSHNPLGHGGVMAIAVVLSNNPPLRYLNLQHTSGGEEANRALTRAISENVCILNSSTNDVFLVPKRTMNIMNMPITLLYFALQVEANAHVKIGSDIVSLVLTHSLFKPSKIEARKIVDSLHKLFNQRRANQKALPTIEPRDAEGHIIEASFAKRSRLG